MELASEGGWCFMFFFFFDQGWCFMLVITVWFATPMAYLTCLFKSTGANQPTCTNLESKNQVTGCQSNVWGERWDYFTLKSPHLPVFFSKTPLPPRMQRALGILPHRSHCDRASRECTARFLFACPIVSKSHERGLPLAGLARPHQDPPGGRQEDLQDHHRHHLHHPDHRYLIFFTCLCSWRDADAHGSSSIV